MLLFQAQNHRELSFKKGDLVYIRRQVDGNWYEGERNAMIGILPITYVEIIPAMDNNTLQSRPKSATGQAAQEGQAKAKFNFQSQTPMELSLIKGLLRFLRRMY